MVTKEIRPRERIELRLERDLHLAKIEARLLEIGNVLARRSQEVSDDADLRVERLGASSSCRRGRGRRGGARSRKHRLGLPQQLLLLRVRRLRFTS